MIPADTSDQVLWVAACAIICLGTLIFILVRRVRRIERLPPKRVVVDGSNIMYWNDNTPKIATIREVLSHLSALGYAWIAATDIQVPAPARARDHRTGHSRHLRT